MSSAGTKLGASVRVVQALNHRTISLVCSCLSTCYVAKGDLEFWNFQLHLWNYRHVHPQLVLVVGEDKSQGFVPGRQTLYQWSSFTPWPCLSFSLRFSRSYLPVSSSRLLSLLVSMAHASVTVNTVGLGCRMVKEKGKESQIPITLSLLCCLL